MQILHDANVNICVFVKYIRPHVMHKYVILQFDSWVYAYECIYIRLHNDIMTLKLNDTLLIYIRTFGHDKVYMWKDMLYMKF